MKFLEPKTFRGAMSPVTLIRGALGIGSLEYPKGRPRRVMFLCWSSTILIIALCVFKYRPVENVWDLEKSTLTETTFEVFIIINTICGITFVYLGKVRSKSVADSFRGLDKVNEMLNKVGIPKEYGSTFKSHIIHLIGGFVFALTMTFSPIIQNYHSFNNTVMQLIGTIIGGQYTLVVSFIEDYTFSTCIRYIGKRFRYLNTYLSKLSISEENAKAFPQGSEISVADLPHLVPRDHVHSQSVAVAKKQWLMDILQDTKQIHRDLCSIAKNLNKAFGVQILGSMTMAIAAITTMLYNTYFLTTMPTITAADFRFRILTNLVWIGFYAIKVFYVISACSMASNEAHQTGDRIHDLVNPTTCNEIREEIHAFSLGLMQDPLQFTACGFFDLDHTMIRAMAGTVTTYLVIMIQMPHTSYQGNNSTTNAMIPAENITV